MACDPGRTTGFAMVNTDDDRYFTNQFASSLYQRAHQVFWNMLNNKMIPDCLIIEKFLHRNQTNTVYDGLEYQGILQLWAEEHNIEIVWQKLSDVNKFWDERKIKAMNLWTAGMPHAMDAMRHLLAYRMSTEPRFEKEALQTLRGI